MENVTKSMKLEKDIALKDPQKLWNEVQAKIEKKTETLPDYLYGGIALIHQEKYEDAEKFLEKGFSYASSKLEKAALYYLQANALYFSCQKTKSVEIAKLAQAKAKKAVQNAPENVGYSILWQLCSAAAGDKEEEKIASLNIQKANPTAEFKEVMDPILGSVIIMIVVAISDMYLHSDKDQRDRILNIMETILLIDDASINKK